MHSSYTDMGWESRPHKYAGRASRLLTLTLGSGMKHTQSSSWGSGETLTHDHMEGTSNT